MDVRVHTNQPNVYFDGGHIWVQYDTSVFNPNIANSGFFNASLCPDFQSDSYDFYSLSNPAADTLEIIAGPNYGYVLNRVLLDTVPKPFLHLAFAVNPNNASHGIAFQTITAPLGNPTYAIFANAPFDQYFDFDTIIHLPSDTFSFPSNHIPIILEKDSEPKIAGIGDSLTIRGLNFGDTRGEVFFKAADDGGQSYLLGLDDQYHILWSDTLIKVIVPSIVYKGYDNNIGQSFSGGAGTGFFKIQTNPGDTNLLNNADNFISIHYSVTNKRDNSNIIRRIHLARQHCDYDYLFVLHRSLEQDSIKISRIDSALRAWSQITGLTLLLERDTNGFLIFVDSINITGKTTIYLDSDSGSGLMTTFQNFGEIIVGNAPVIFGNTSAAIRIKQQPSNGSWNYNFSGFVGNQFSFYQAFLHEIGHILLMGHVNDIAEVMYYSVRKNSNIIIPDTSSWAVKGVLANIEASRNINWPANSGLYPIGVRKPTITIANNNPPYICNGAALTLQANPSGEQFSWSTGATTPSISVNNAGLYSVSLTDGECTLSDSISIGTSTLQATLTATDVNCPNNASGSISTQVSGDYPPFSYLWSGNGITPATTSQINNLSPGTYYLTLSDSVGCHSNHSKTIFSTIEELLVCIPRIYENPNSFCTPTAIYTYPSCKHPLFCIVTGGAPPYQFGWYFNEMACDTVPNQVQYISTSYYVCNPNIPIRQSLYLHVQDSCGQSILREITSDMLQNREKSINTSWDVVLYPNPTTGNITFQSPDSKVQKVEVYDIYGKLLQTTNTNSISADINVSDLAAGIYVAQIYADNGVINKKFVKN